MKNKKEIEQNFIFDEVTRFLNEKACVRIGNSWFLIDIKGKILNKIIAEELEQLDNGFFKIKKFDKCGVIDNSLKYIIRPKYDEIMYAEDDLYIVKNRKKYGIINQNEEKIVKYKYDKIAPYLLKKSHFEAKFKGKYGVINSNDDTIIPFEYEEGFFANLRYPYLLSSRKNGNVGVINFKNQILIPFEYEDLYIIDKNKIYADGNVIDFKNNYLYELNVEWLDVLVSINEDRFKVQKNGKTGFVDKLGNLKIDYKYTSAFSFIDGFCEVQNGNKAGLIDKNDNLILPFEYDFHSLFFIDNNLFKASKNYKFGIVDKSNKIIVNFIFDDIGYDFNNGYITACYNGKYGFLDKKGNPLKINIKDFIDELDTVEQTKFIFDGKILE